MAFPIQRLRQHKAFRRMVRAEHSTVMVYQNLRFSVWMGLARLAQLR